MRLIARLHINGNNGSGLYYRHLQGVNDEVAILQSEGFIILGTEVPAVVDGLDIGRRFDIVVQNPLDQTIFGVEVKTSLSGSFSLNPV